MADGYFSKQATAFKKTEHIGVMEIKNWTFEQLQEAGIAIVGDPDAYAQWQTGESARDGQVGSGQRAAQAQGVKEEAEM